MKAYLCAGIVFLVFLATPLKVSDEGGIHQVLEQQVAAWNRGDAAAYAENFAEDGTFTNLLGMYFEGKQAFQERHDQIFKTSYKGSKKQEDVVSIRFVRPDVAIVETLQSVTGYQKLLPGTTADAKGRLRTRLLQVMVKENGVWKIATYHNIDVKPGIPVPEPK